MKYFITICVISVFYLSAFAQDVITKKDGTDIKAKIEEVGQKDIKYKEFSNLEGPTSTIAKTDVLMIQYENGDKDIFTDSQASENQTPQGIMTLDRKAGKLAINGVVIDKSSTHLYLSSEAEAMYKSGDSVSSIGDVLMGIGLGGAAGYFVGSMAGGGDPGSGAGFYAVCGGLVLIGLPLHLIGVNKIKKAISDYNSKNGYASHPAVISVGSQQYGFGLALNF